MTRALSLLLGSIVLHLLTCNAPAPVPPPPVPPPPTQHMVTLSWEVPTEADSFLVQRAPCLDFAPGSNATSGTCTTPGTFSQIGTTTLQSYTDATVLVGQAYDYQVVANYSDGEVFTSNAVAAFIPATSSHLRLSIGVLPSKFAFDTALTLRK